MICFGEVPANSVLPIPFDSFAGATGASITITGLAVTDIEVYKGVSMTQRSSDAGYVLMDTDGIDLDGITGIQGFSIDLSDNTDAGFYAVGSFFWVVVSAITVDAQTVNFIAATFRIKAAEAIAGKPKVDVDAWLGTAAATPTVAGVPEVDLTHWLGTAASTPTVAGVPNVNAKTWNDLTTVALPLVPATAGRTLVVDTSGLADANTVKVGPTGSGTAQTARDLGGTLGVAGAGLTDLGGMSTTMKAQVNTEVVDTLATDTYAEPAQGTPVATTTIATKLGFLYKAWRNRYTQNATEYALYADDATTKDQEAIVSDDGTTFDRGEVSTGA